jgi:hypothetical protein
VGAQRPRPGGSARAVIAGGLSAGLSLLLKLPAAAKSPGTNGQIVHGNNTGLCHTTERKCSMRRIALCVGLAAVSLVFVCQAAAATDIPVSMSFTEPIVPNIEQGCPVFSFTDNGFAGFCGNGVVLPFGHANETIQFGQGIDCVANTGSSPCDLRTINLPEGTIISDELNPTGSCPGICQPNRAEPGRGLLLDTIIPGQSTGIFSGTTGTFDGTVTFAGPSNTLHFTGTITLP